MDHLLSNAAEGKGSLQVYEVALCKGLHYQLSSSYKVVIVVVDDWRDRAIRRLR